MRALYPKSPESQIDAQKLEKYRQRKMHSLASNTDRRRQDYMNQVTGTMFAMSPDQKRQAEKSLIKGVLDDALP